MEFKVLIVALLVSAVSANHGWGSPAAVQQVQNKPTYGPVTQQQHQHNANCGHNQVQHHDRYQPVVQQAYTKPVVAPVQTNYVRPVVQQQQHQQRPVVYQQQQQVYNKPVAPVQHNNVVYNRQPKAYNHVAPVQNQVQHQTYVQRPVVYQQQQVHKVQQVQYRPQVQKVHQPVVYQQPQQVRPVQHVQKVQYQPQVQRVQQVHQVQYQPQVQRVQQVQYQPQVQKVQQVQRVQQVQYQPQVQKVQQVHYQPQVQRVQQVHQVQRTVAPVVQRPVVHQTNYVQNNRQPKVYPAPPAYRAPVHQQPQQTYYRPAAPAVQHNNYIAKAPVYAQNYQHQRDFQAYAPQQTFHNNRPFQSQVYAGGHPGSGINFQKSFSNPLFSGNFGFNAGRTYGGNFGYGVGNALNALSHPVVGTVARGLGHAVSRFIPQIRLAKQIGNARTVFNFPSFRINRERVLGPAGYGLGFSAAAGRK